MAAVKLSTKAVGSKVKIKVNGTARNFIVIHQGLPSSLYDSSCNGTWLLMEDVYETRAWHSSNVNDYANSTIHTYLNGTFLALIDSTISSQIKQVKIPYRAGSGTSKTVTSGSSGLSAKIFLLSGYEVDSGSATNLPVDGAALSYFSGISDDKRIGYLNGTATIWWLRSPSAGASTGAWYARATSGSCTYGGCADSHGIRPAFVLPSTLYVDDSSNVFAPTTPTTPASITVPATIKGGEAFTVSWGTSTSADGLLGGYRLERQINGGVWEQIQQGTATSKSETLALNQADTVAYRVKAYTTAGMESAARTSATITVINNQPPTTPSAITCSRVRAGNSVTLTCGASTDPDGDAITYVWERRVDTDVWRQIAITSTTTTTDTVPTSGTNYQVRVRAADTAGNESAYRTGEAVPIIYNDPPTVTGSDQDLGDLTASGIGYAYTVTDDNDANISVTERLDGAVIRTYSAANGTENTLSVSGDAWTKVLNGRHTVTITATDSSGESTTRTLTFTRNQSQMSVLVKSPKSSEFRPTRMALNLSAAIPAGAVLQVLACNNALDDSPAWEDVTQAITMNQAHIFANKSKTAASWAVNVLISVDRGGAEGDCYVVGFVLSYDTDNSAAVAALLVDQEYRMTLLELGVM